MAGENVLPVEVMPDVFQYVSVQLSNDSEDLGGGRDAYIFFCEEDTVLDSAFLSFTTVDDSNDATYQLGYQPSGLFGSGTAAGPEAAFASGKDLTTATTSGTDPDVTLNLTVNESNNIIPKGNRICLRVNGTSDIEGVNITIRIRTRRR
jgi:hypothetical protein